MAVTITQPVSMLKCAQIIVQNGVSDPSIENIDARYNFIVPLITHVLSLLAEEKSQTSEVSLSLSPFDAPVPKLGRLIREVTCIRNKFKMSQFSSNQNETLNRQLTPAEWCDL